MSHTHCPIQDTWYRARHCMTSRVFSPSKRACTRFLCSSACVQTHRHVSTHGRYIVTDGRTCCTEKRADMRAGMWLYVASYEHMYGCDLIQTLQLLFYKNRLGLCFLFLPLGAEVRRTIYLVPTREPLVDSVGDLLHHLFRIAICRIDGISNQPHGGLGPWGNCL